MKAARAAVRTAALFFDGFRSGREPCIESNMNNLIDKFLEKNATDLAAPACIHEGKVVSRGAFLRAVCDFTAALQLRGVQPGDVVGLSLGQHPGHLAMILALARLGAVSLPVHPRSPMRAKLALLRRMGATRVIVQSLAPTSETQNAPPPIEGLEVIALPDLQLKEGDARAGHKLDLRGMLDYWPTADAPARISLTSGTTGVPSAVCYDHAYWLNRIATTVEFCDANTRLMAGNLSLTMGNISAFAALFAGGVVVFFKQHDLSAYIQTVNLYAVTHAMMAPAMIKKMASRLPLGVAFPSIRYLRIVGGGLSEPLVAMATGRLTPHVYLPYGISEVGAISMASPEDLKLYPDRAGKPKKGVKVQVVDENDKVLSPGEVGEIRVKLPVMLPGYHQDEEKTKAKFKRGWFYTSDMGTLTTDGFVRIDGRKDDRINLGGSKFYPERVERLLDGHPGVQEMAVFEAELKGEPALVAAVVWKTEAGLQSLLDFAKAQRLPANMAPKGVMSLKELPRNEAGKVLRSELRALFDQNMHNEKPVLH